MKRERCNPFIDAPLTMKRIVLMAVSTIVFVASAIYGTIRGVLGFCSKNKRERRDDFHVMMNKIFRWELRIHPWLHCDINNPYSEHFERGAIAICNHQSLLDTLCLLILSPKLLIVTGKRVWNNPIVKPVLFFADFICVNRSVDDMLEYCRSHIAEGYTIVFFPEGQRSINGRILRFHSGAFYIAKELQADILPLYLHGTGHVLPLHKAFQNKSKMYIEIGHRINSKDLPTYTDARLLANFFRRHYELHYEEICKRLEKTDYYANLIISLYGKIRKKRFAANLLLKYDNFSEWIDISFNENACIMIDDHTDGVFTLMFALVHPHILIYSIGSSVLNMLCGKCRNLPSNINCFIDEKNRIDLKKSRVYKNLFSVDNLVTVYTEMNINKNFKHYETACS